MIKQDTNQKSKIASPIRMLPEMSGEADRAHFDLEPEADASLVEGLFTWDRDA